VIRILESIRHVGQHGIVESGTHSEQNYDKKMNREKPSQQPTA